MLLPSQDSRAPSCLYRQARAQPSSAVSQEEKLNWAMVKVRLSFLRGCVPTVTELTPRRIPGFVRKSTDLALGTVVRCWIDDGAGSA